MSHEKRDVSSKKGQRVTFKYIKEIVHKENIRRELSGRDSGAIAVSGSDIAIRSLAIPNVVFRLWQENCTFLPSCARSSNLSKFVVLALSTTSTSQKLYMYFWVVGCRARFLHFIVHSCDENGNSGEMFLKSKGSSNKLLHATETEVSY